MRNEKQQKTVLAFDTAMAGVSVGLVAANGHIVSRIVETQRGQAAMLVPMIQEVLGEAGLTLKDVDLIVTSIGPGSFTGLRIGLSTARTLGLALAIPVVGVMTLDLMAHHYLPAYVQASDGGENDKSLLVVLETKRQDFYARYYDSDMNPLTEAFAADASVILERAPSDLFLIGGDCINRFKSVSCADCEALDNLTQPDPILMAQYGLDQYKREGDQGAPQPLYLRGADVSVSNKVQRILEGKTNP